MLTILDDMFIGKLMKNTFKILANYFNMFDKIVSNFYKMFHQLKVIKLCMLVLSSYGSS